MSRARSIMVFGFSASGSGAVIAVVYFAIRSTGAAWCMVAWAVLNAIVGTVAAICDKAGE